MSILSSVTSILEQLIRIPEIGVPRGDGKQSGLNDDHKGRDDYSNSGDKDGHSKHGKDDYSTLAKNDDCQLHTYNPGEAHNPGEALAKFDFSRGDFGSHGPDHSGDVLGALASMSSDDALEYAIGQMGPADHFDVGHVGVAADTSNDTDA